MTMGACSEDASLHVWLTDVSRLKACVHARTHTHTHTRTYAHTHAHTHTYTYTHTNTHTYTHTHMYKRAQSTHKLPVHSAKGFANFSASLAMLPPTCHIYASSLSTFHIYASSLSTFHIYASSLSMFHPYLWFIPTYVSSLSMFHPCLCAGLDCTAVGDGPSQVRHTCTMYSHTYTHACLHAYTHTHTRTHTQTHTHVPIFLAFAPAAF
jgi:hypothetical protein